MAALMFYNRDPHAVWIGLPEINKIRKSRHHCPAQVPSNHHPPGRGSGNPQDLTLKFINEFPPKSGHSALVKITNLSEFAFDSGVIFDGHRRSFAIISSWDTAWTWPDSISRSRSSAKAAIAASSI
jgi:hypothetical protein